MVWSRSQAVKQQPLFSSPCSWLKTERGPTDLLFNHFDFEENTPKILFFDFFFLNVSEHKALGFWKFSLWNV